MKSIYKYIVCLLLGSGCLASCSNNEEGVTPSSIANLHYDSTPGRIVLRWDTPDDGTIRYIQVNFYNYLTKQDEMRTASIYADSINIPETREKYGEYTFSVRTVSPDGTLSEAQVIKATSKPKEKTWTPSAMKLTAEMLGTNAQEPSEGPIAGLVDDNTATFFHTAWSVDIPGPHYMTVALPKTIDGWWQFYYAPRANGNNKPTDFDLQGSTDGQNWFLIKNFTKDGDKLPVDSKTTYMSPRMDASSKPFKHLKFIVNATNSNSVFWTMSEFKVYTVALIDPEAPDEN